MSDQSSSRTPDKNFSQVLREQLLQLEMQLMLAHEAALAAGRSTQELLSRRPSGAVRSFERRNQPDTLLQMPGEVEPPSGLAGVLPPRRNSEEQVTSSSGLAGVLPTPMSTPSVSDNPQSFRAGLSPPHRSKARTFQIHVQCNLQDEDLAYLEAPFVSTKPSKASCGPSPSLATAWPRCLLHPESKKRLLWDCLACIMLLTYAVVVPLQVFRRFDVSAEMMASTISIRSAWLLFWLVDIAIVLRTAVYVDNVVCIQWSKIISKYVRSWMLLDLCFIGLDVWCLACLVRQQPIFRVAALGKHFFIGRGLFSFAVQELFRLRSFGSKVCWKLMLVFVAVATAMHLLACLWFFVGNVEDGWVTEELTQETWTVQYGHSVQWALSRLPAASMSANMALQTGQERCLAIAATFGALCCGSVSVSVVTNFLARLERSRQCKKKVLEAANRYIQDNDLPGAYMKQVKLLVEQEDLRQAKMNHLKQLQELPEGISQELFREARGRTLSAFKFFQQIQKDSAAETSICSVAVELFHLPEDVVFRANVKSKGLFLVSGCTYNVAEGARRVSAAWKSWQTLEERPWWQMLWKKFSNRVALMRQVSDGRSDGDRVQVGIGEAMSEQALWIMAWQHQGTLLATCNGSGVLLQTKEFYKILAEHPNIMFHAVLHARDFVSHTNQLLRSGERCTDLPLPTG